MEMTADEIVQYALDCGVSVSRAQLERWHKAGLLPLPRRVHLGRGRGTESRYPAHAAPQAVTIAFGRELDRSLDSMAWYAWCHRHPVTPYVRAMLLRRLDTSIRAMREQLALFAVEHPVNAIDGAEHLPTPEGFDRVPKALRPTLRYLIMRMQLGELGDHDDRLFESDEEAALLFPVLAKFARAQKRRASVALSIRDAVRMTAREFNLPRSRNALARLDDAQLERTRDLALSVAAFLETRVGASLRPLPIELFLMVFMATRVSRVGRYLAMGFRQALKKGGFTNFAEAFDAFQQLRKARDAGAASSDATL